MNASVRLSTRTVVVSSFVTLMMLVSLSEEATQADYYDLIDKTFEHYRKEVRPVTDDSNATVVYVSFWLQSIVNLDERNQVLTTSVIIDLFWIDEWLTWDPLSVGGITQLRYPQDKLWLPDVIVANSVQSQTQLGYKECPCSIRPDGGVAWQPSEILETSCDMDVTYYPFDEQECRIILSTWMSPRDDIVLKVHVGFDDTTLLRYSPSSTWDIISTYTLTVPDTDDLSRVQYNFRFKRRSTFYVLNIIVPVCLLSLTASAVFYLPAEAGEKIGMSMTVLLAFAVYQTILSDNLPQTSLQVSILSVYLAALLGICGMSVFMSVFVLHLHHSPSEQPVGQRTMRIIKKLRNFLCTGHRYRSTRSKDGDKSNVNLTAQTMDKCTANNRNGQYNRRTVKVAPINDKQVTDLCAVCKGENDQANLQGECVTWTVVAETVDGVFFFATSLSIFLLTVICMTLLVRGHPTDK